MIYPLSDRKGKHIKGLLQKKNRVKYSEYIAEGFSIVDEALRRPRDVLSLLIDEDILDKASAQIDLAESKAIPVFTTYHENFAKFSDTKNPAGIMAVVKRDIDRERKRIYRAIESDNAFIIYVEEIQDPGNFGSIIRNAEALGAHGVITGSGTVDITNPKVIRGAMGAHFFIPVVNTLEIGFGLNGFKNRDFRIAATVLDDKALSIWEYKTPDKLLLAFGNEAAGLSDKVIDIADELLTIPISGKSDSLSVASASAIFIASLTSQRKVY